MHVGTANPASAASWLGAVLHGDEARGSLWKLEASSAWQSHRGGDAEGIRLGPVRPPGFVPDFAHGARELGRLDSHWAPGSWGSAWVLPNSKGRKRCLVLIYHGIYTKSLLVMMCMDNSCIGP